MAHLSVLAADAMSISGRRLELRRFVKSSLCLTDSAKNLAVADHLAAQAVGDCLKKRVAITDMQRTSGAKYLVELIVGEMNWRHERPPCIVGER
jgi:hypothetical protein